MTIALGARGVRAVVLDIEGTTTPVSFVYETLFPYARERIHEHLAGAMSEETRRAVELLREEWSMDVGRGEPVPAHGASSIGDDELAGYVEWLMDRDRKSPGLKLLQGEIWQRGFADGTLRGELYPDVPPALARWRAAGITTAIYSSGSAAAQRMIFASTAWGDLTPRIAHFFDTGVGPKRSSDSYRRIADAVGIAPARVLFVSDVPDELHAARGPGMQTALCIRPGNAVQHDGGEIAIHTFGEITD